MDFSLSSSLVGSAVSNPDKLALDLQFATDKALTARKGPTPAFTRGSGATFVDSDGLVKYGAENIILQSENFSAANWSKFGSTISSDLAAAPDGTITADKLVESTSGGLHGTFQNPTTTSGVTHIGSCYIKAAGRNFAVVYTGAFPANGRYISIPADGTGTVLGLFSANPSNVTLQYVGNGWYRVTILIVSSGAGTSLEIYSAISGTNSSYTGDGTSGVLIWGAQLERFSSARTYIPTTTSAVYGPRFDHDPVTLDCKGLLIEESRTNLLVQSDNFTQSIWTKLGLSVTADALASPDGLVTSDLITEDSNSSVHAVQQTGYTLTASQPYTFSVFAKGATHTSVQISLSTAAFGGASYANFVLTGSGSIGSLSGVTAKIDSYPNGWYRCSVTITSVSGGTGGNVAVVANNNNSASTRNPSYLGTEAQVAYIWGAQLELGSFPTSYIPTTTASVVRSADVCSITGSDFSGFYNQPEGTLFADVTPQTVDQLSVAVGVNTSASTRSHFIYKTNSAINAAGKRWAAQTVNDAGAQTAIPTSTDVAISRARLAYGYKLNDFAFAYAGVIVGTDTIGTIPVPTAMRIGSRDDGLYINGHIESVRYYKKRLTNAKIQAITV